MVSDLWDKLFKPLPFPTSGKKSDMIVWIIESQQQDNARLKVALFGFITTFITLIVTGKLVWGWF